jgi:hypothetical protein
MKKFLVVALVALATATLAPSIPALAGGCGGGGGGCGAGGGACCKSDDGFDCTNVCPLAQEANKHRAIGRESLAASPSLRATPTANVQRNLARI